MKRRRTPHGELFYYISKSGAQIPIGSSLAQAESLYRLMLAQDNRTAVPTILSEEEIVAAATPPTVQYGVYFLVKADRVVYVGMSKDVHKRLNEHRASRKDFDRVFVILCELIEARRLEALYIAKLNPPLNLTFGRNFGRPKFQAVENTSQVTV